MVEQKRFAFWHKRQKAENAAQLVNWWLDKSTRIIGSNNITDRVNLTSSKDVEAFTLFFTQRMFRTSIYDSSWLLSNPAVFKLSNVPVINTLIRSLDSADRRNRQVLEHLNNVSEVYLKTAFAAGNDSRRVRTIELAANDLIARATDNNPNSTKTKIIFTSSLLNDWGNIWVDRLQVNKEPHSSNLNS